MTARPQYGSITISPEAAKDLSEAIAKAFAPALKTLEDMRKELHEMAEVAGVPLPRKSKPENSPKTPR